MVLGAVIGGPSTPCFPPAALSAARAHAASPLTSSVAPAPSAPDLSAGLSRDSRQDPASLPSRQGRPLRRTQDAFVRREPVPAPSEEERRAGSRRRLQPVQPASTTTNPSIPGCLPARLAQLALNRWGGGPIRHVDCMDPGSAAARPPPTVLADRAEHLARTPAGSARARGRRAFARRRLPLARHDASLAGALPRPDLPGHLSSRSRAGIGWRVRCHARALRRPKPNAWRHQLRHPGLRPPGPRLRADLERRRARGPPYALLAQAARDVSALSRGGREPRRPAAALRSRGRLRHASRYGRAIEPPAPTACAACPCHPTIQGQGPLHPSLREEPRDLPRPRCLSSRTAAGSGTKLALGCIVRWQGVFHRMSPACGKHAAHFSPSRGRRP